MQYIDLPVEMRHHIFMAYVAFFSSIKVLMTIIHVLTAVCAMGAAFSADVLFHFYASNRTLSRAELRTLSILSRVVWYGLLALVMSGGAIMLSDPAKYLLSVKFLAKMTVVCVLVVNGIVLNAYVSRHLAREKFLSARREAFARHVAFACGAISAISWVSALALGVMDNIRFSYAGVIGVYAGLLFIGVIGSFIFERVAFASHVLK